MKYKFMVMGFVFFLVVIIGLLDGAAKITIQDFIDLMAGGELTRAGRILLFIRIPRVMGAIVAGAGLAVAGAIIQTILNNPLAGPNIIGVNSGAGLMVVICGLLFPNQFRWMPLAAFVGAFVAVMFVYYLGKKTSSSRITLVLAGVAINSVLYGVIDAIHSFSDVSLISSNVFRIGGLAGIDLMGLLYAGIVVLVAFVMVLMFHNELELFSLGEDKAKTLGLPISFYRFLFLALAASLAGASVSFAGLLGFIGLMVPHIARLLVGAESRPYILASAILGSIILLFCDWLARVLFAPYELPVGIILSFVGAPFFLWLLLFRRKGNRNA